MSVNSVCICNRPVSHMCILAPARLASRTRAFAARSQAPSISTSTWPAPGLHSQSGRPSSARFVASAVVAAAAAVLEEPMTDVLPATLHSSQRSQQMHPHFAAHDGAKENLELLKSTRAELEEVLKGMQDAVPLEGFDLMRDDARAQLTAPPPAKRGRKPVPARPATRVTITGATPRAKAPRTRQASNADGQRAESSLVPGQSPAGDFPSTSAPDITPSSKARRGAPKPSAAPRIPLAAAPPAQPAPKPAPTPPPTAAPQQAATAASAPSPQAPLSAPPTPTPQPLPASVPWQQQDQQHHQAMHHPQQSPLPHQDPHLPPHPEQQQQQSWGTSPGWPSGPQNGWPSPPQNGWPSGPQNGWPSPQNGYTHQPQLQYAHALAQQVPASMASQTQTVAPPHPAAQQQPYWPQPALGQWPAAAYPTQPQTAQEQLEQQFQQPHYQQQQQQLEQQQEQQVTQAQYQQQVTQYHWDLYQYHMQQQQQLMQDPQWQQQQQQQHQQLQQWQQQQQQQQQLQQWQQQPQPQQLQQDLQQRQQEAEAQAVLTTIPVPAEPAVVAAAPAAPTVVPEGSAQNMAARRMKKVRVLRRVVEASSTATTTKGKAAKAAASDATTNFQTSLSASQKTGTTQFFKTISQTELLEASQEKQLALLVQDYLQLEMMEAVLRERVGREPTLTEMAREVKMDAFAFNERMYAGKLAKRKMVDSNMRLVVSIAKQYQHKGLSLQELITEGITGLVRGVEKFDPSKGFKFSTYAHWWVRQAMTRSLAEQGRVVRLPTHLQDAMGKLRRVKAQYVQAHGKDPTPAEVAKLAGLTEERVVYLYSLYQQAVSLDQPFGGDKDAGTIEEGLASETAIDPVENAVQQAMRVDLEAVVNTLPEREAMVLKLRYGLGGHKEMTLDDIGRQFKVTRERIRQIEAKAIRRLRSPTRQALLKEHTDSMSDNKRGAATARRSRGLMKT